MESITHEVALARILERCVPMPITQLGLLDSVGHVLADDLVAPRSIPADDNSAMDGYAVRSRDVVPGTRLLVVGDLRAGTAPDVSVVAGTAVRIMTGACIPHGADAVIPYELTSIPGEPTDARASLSPLPPTSIVINTEARADMHVRHSGEDIKRGTLLFRAGSPVTPATVAILAAMGCSTVAVHRRPTVAVLSTGDELVEPGASRRKGQVYNSNGPALGAMVLSCGARLHAGPPVPDSMTALGERLSEVVDLADLIITSGGASGGAFDVVGRLGERQETVQSFAVRMKPGKPLSLGWLRRSRDEGSVPYVGLPGNPIAALVAFELFAKPAIYRMRGLDAPASEIIAQAGHRFENPGSRTNFVRVNLERHDGSVIATSVGRHGSSALSSLIGMHGLAELPPAAVVEPGASVHVRLVRWADAEYC